MTSPAASYHGYRFPPDIISPAVWLYHRFCVSFRDTEAAARICSGRPILGEVHRNGRWASAMPASAESVLAHS